MPRKWKPNANQRDALAFIATGAPLQGFSPLTFYALERHGLIEHTSLGWRLTPAGEAVRAAR